MGDVNIHRYTPVAQRFNMRVQKTDTCWLWLGKLDKDGYGRLRVDGLHVKAHRYAYELQNGDIPDGMLVCHKCDNPQCVNPDHLFLGTCADNIADRNAKGRTASGDSNASRKYPGIRKLGKRHWWAKGQPHHPQGTKNGRSKLSESDVLEIRRLWDEGEYTKVALGKQFGVSDVIILKVIRRQLWAHVK